MHAARSRRWRDDRPPADGVGDIRVTHQGEPEPGSPAIEDTLVGRINAGEAIAVTCQVGRCCRNCSRPLGSWVRQAFLRHRNHVRTRPRGEVARPSPRGP